MEHLGPLTYLVETTNRLLWKRHIDLLRELCVHDHITEDHNSEELGDLEETTDPEAALPPALVPIPTVPESVAPEVSASVAPLPGFSPLADSPMQSASNNLQTQFEHPLSVSIQDDSDSIRIDLFRDELWCGILRLNRHV